MPAPPADQQRQQRKGKHACGHCDLLHGGIFGRCGLGGLRLRGLLGGGPLRLGSGGLLRLRPSLGVWLQIGRASCRERVLRLV